MSEGEVADPSEAWTLSRGRVGAFALLLLVDFVIVAVMLATDKNLQTDFGTVQSGYYFHWYGLLVEGILDLIVAVAVVSTISLSAMKRQSFSSRKYVVIGGLGWTVVAILAMLGIVFTYQQVGFSSMTEFAKYLFGTTAYAGVGSYIPWLYDLLLAAYILTALVGALATRKVRSVSSMT
jgi:hypothetical protein